MADTPEQRMIIYLRNMGYDVSTGDYAHPANRIAALEKRITELENRTGLISKSWFTRAYTAWVYVLIAQLLIALVFIFIALVFGIFGG